MQLGKEFILGLGDFKHKVLFPNDKNTSRKKKKKKLENKYF